MNAAPQRARARGFTLLEVLVTVLIVSIGLLGLLGLQTVSLVSTQVSAARSQASIFADNIADRMRANPKAVQEGAYADVTAPAAGGAPALPTPNCYEDKCSAKQMAEFDVREWQRALWVRLPHGRGFIDCVNSDPCRSYRITIGWQERDHPQVAAGLARDHCARDFVSRCFQTVIRP